MSSFISALWAETLKLRRSKVPLFTAIGFSIAPLVGGLFMNILKDPAKAQSMGLISAKAQLTVGVAEWATLFNLLAQATAVGGMIVFSVFTAWVFGREFSDHTVKELLALPTPREAIIGAKFTVVLVWTFILTLLGYMLGLIVGRLVDIPGWSLPLLRSASTDIIGAGILTIYRSKLRGIRPKVIKQSHQNLERRLNCCSFSELLMLSSKNLMKNFSVSSVPLCWANRSSLSVAQPHRLAPSTDARPNLGSHPNCTIQLDHLLGHFRFLSRPATR